MNDKLEIPILALSDLSSIDETVRAGVRQSILDAFGTSGPGLLLVRNLPQTYYSHREDLLAAGNKLPLLPPEELEALEFPALRYSVGWSHGREMFRGKPDVSKASFYANPLYEDPSLGNQELVDKYPFTMYPNCWPSSTLVEQLQPSFKYIGRFLSDIALMLAEHCDALVQNSQPTGENRPSMYKMLSSSRACKGRLLHYFPQEASNEGDALSGKKDENLWCGYHNDHGMITGLLPAQYFNRHGHLTPSSDKTTGLYVVPGGSNVPYRASIPSDCIAFQIGEAAQILTGGVLRATPHAVRAPRPSSNPLSRITLALFFQPNPWDELHLPNDALNDALASTQFVPSLGDRFNDGDSFAQFTQATLASFYGHND